MLPRPVCQTPHTGRRREGAALTIGEQAAPAVARRIWGTLDTPADLRGVGGGVCAQQGSDAVLHRALPGARSSAERCASQAMVFGDPQTAAAAVRAVNAAHRHVEEQRERRIPQWAYRDTLFMLIDYGERAHRIVFKPMTDAERRCSFEASRLIGEQLGIRGVPPSYAAYHSAREQHLRHHLAHSDLTDRLYGKYEEALGPVRMALLRDLQASLVPARVRSLLGLRRRRYVEILLRAYRHVRGGWLLWLLSPLLLPGHGGTLRALSRPGE